ncbi:MAG: T9SS type A sorting domain-containing protein [Ignavibacteria bacterium]|jgi:WD40 repeat protein|nr:T9SS type A sorting domain-containing protein [Ignavibacteria bacterium]
MKKILILLIVFVGYTASAAVTLLDYNVQQFPEVRTKFCILDNWNRPLADEEVSSGAIKLLDNGSSLTIKEFRKCQQPNGKSAVVIVFDLGIGNRTSNSSNFTYAKQVTNECISYMDEEQTELALLTFSTLPSVDVDYTNSFADVAAVVSGLTSYPTSNLYRSFAAVPTGGISFLSDKNVANKSVLLVTQGIISNDETELIVAQAKQANVKINIIYISASVPQNIKRIADETGGYYINSKQMTTAELPFLSSIAKVSEGWSPYELVADANLNCDGVHTFSVVTNYGSGDWTDEIEHRKLTQIVPNPSALHYPSVIPGTSQQRDVLLIASSAPITITNISISNPQFVIDAMSRNLPVSLAVGEQMSVRISFHPTDSSISFAKLIVQSDACLYDTLYLTGGFPNVPPKNKTIQLTKPKCNETLVIGDSIDISWLGVLPKDVVSIISYSNNTNLLDTFAPNVVGLNKKYYVPDNGEDSIRFIINQMWPNNVGKTLDFRHSSKVRTAFFNNYQDKIITTTDSNLVTIWDSNTGELIYRFPRFNKAIFWAIYSPNPASIYDRYIAITGQDSSAYLFDATDYSLVWKYKANTSLINSIEFSKDGKYAVIAIGNGSFDVIDVATGQKKTSKKINTENCRYAQFHPTKEYEIMAISSYDGIIRFFDLDGNQTDTIDVREGANVIISPYATYNWDGSKLLFVNTIRGTAQLLDIASKQILHSYSHKKDTNSTLVHFASFFHSETEDYVLTSSNDNTLKRWNVSDGLPSVVPTDFIEHTNPVNTGVFNTDGWRALSASDDHTAKIWNLNQKTLQSDTTCMLKVAYAKGVALDTIRMGNSYVSDISIKTVERCFENTCDFGYNILAIRIIDDEYGEFGIADEFEFPLRINGRGTITLNLTFRPTAEGVRSAKIQIVIPNGMLEVVLEGVGINVGLKSLADYIDFGEVYVDDYKEIVVPIAVNVSGDTISIHSLTITGPDSRCFSYELLNKDSVLLDNDTLSIYLRFYPFTAGRKNCVINLQHSYLPFPIRWNVIGTGINVDCDTIQLNINDLALEIGNEVAYPFTIETNGNNTNLDVSEIHFSLSFNASLLYPTTYSDEVRILGDRIVGTRKIIDISIPYKLGRQVIDGLRLMATFGNDTMSAITISNCAVVGNSRVYIQHNAAMYHLLNYCDADGVRLYDENGRIELSQNVPNPVSHSTNIEYELRENGLAELNLFDMSGNIVQNIFSEYKQKGKYSLTLAVSDLPAGLYYYILQNGSSRKMRMMMVE